MSSAGHFHHPHSSTKHTSLMTSFHKNDFTMSPKIDLNVYFSVITIFKFNNILIFEIVPELKIEISVITLCYGFTNVEVRHLNRSKCS
jgi:hypothetical protein